MRPAYTDGNWGEKMDSKFIANLALARLVKAGVRHADDIEPRLLTPREHDVLSRDGVFCRQLGKLTSQAQLFHLLSIGCSPYFALSAGNRAIRDASPLGYSSSLTNLPGIFGWPMVFNFNKGDRLSISSVSPSMLGASLVLMLYSQVLPYGRMLSGASILDPQLFKLMHDVHGDALLAAIDTARESPHIMSISSQARIGGDILYALICRLSGVGDYEKMLSQIKKNDYQNKVAIEVGKLASALLVIEPDTFKRSSGAVLDTITSLDLATDNLDKAMIRAFLKINETGPVNDVKLEFILSLMSPQSRTNHCIDIIKRLRGVSDECAVPFLRAADLGEISKMDFRDLLGIMKSINSSAKLSGLLEGSPSALVDFVACFHEISSGLHSSEIFDFFDDFANIPASIGMAEYDRARIIEMSEALVCKSMAKVEIDSEFFIGKQSISKYLTRLGQLTQGDIACQKGMRLLKAIEHKDLRASYLEHSDSGCLMRYAGETDTSLRKAIIASDMGL